MKSQIATTRQAIEIALRQYLPSANGRDNQISKAIEYIVSAPGKRLRPVLMLEIARCLGFASEQIMPSACAIEYIHTSSLLLDDLPCMDDAKVRRGQPTVHLAFNEYTAILASIALLMEAFALIARNAKQLNVPQAGIADLVSDTAQTIGLKGMIVGQYLDLSLEDSHLEQQQVDYIHDHKTTVLFEASVNIACTLCGVERQIRDALVEYGRTIGRAFQIADDILDASDEVQPRSKDKHKDAGKTTYVNLLGIEGSKKRLHVLVETAVEAVQVVPSNENLQVLARYIEEQVS
ncbi:MAG TPA: polyprenyl synthetase family protein [bacterium]|nr:polyprenyl synthetase family protein [bacterium]